MVNVGGGVNGGGYLNRLRKENNGQGRQYRSGQAGTPADNKFARDHLRETAHRRRQPITLNAMFAGLDIGDAGAEDSVPSSSLGGQRKYKNGRHCEDGCCPGKPEESKPEPKPFRSADVLGRGRLTAKPSAELGTRFATLGDLGTVAVDTTAKDSHFRKFPNRNYQPGPRYAWLDQSAREVGRASRAGAVRAGARCMRVQPLTRGRMAATVHRHDALPRREHRFSARRSPS